MTGKVPKELKNSTVIPIYRNRDEKKAENYKETGLLNACYKLYSKVLSEKLKAQAEQLLLDCQNAF
jgi:hypothetical protein